MFASLDIIRCYDLEINDELTIPLKIHIKDIKDERGIEKAFGSDEFEYYDENNDKFKIIMNEPHSKYKVIREKILYLNNLKKYLRFIDTDIKIFDHGESNFYEYYNMDDVNELLQILSYNELKRITDKCDEMATNIIAEFFVNVKAFLNNDDICPTIDLDDKPDKLLNEITKFANKPKGYLVSQLSVEFPANPIFEENYGKAISEWSFREIQLQIIYLSEKNKLDSLYERYKSKQYEDSKKEADK